MAFEKIRGIFKPPESQARGMTQEERREAFKKMSEATQEAIAQQMERKRQEAERRAIEEARRHLKELPERISRLEALINQAKDNARKAREMAFEAQPHLYGEKAKPGSFERQELSSVKRDREVQAKLEEAHAEALQREKRDLEYKLAEAKKLLESKGLLGK